MKKKISKIIIEHDDSIYPGQALECVKLIMAEGRISEARGVSKFCHVTTFKSSHGGLEVFCKDRRTKKSADSFVVRRRS